MDFQRRAHLDTFADILKVAKKGTTKTAILHEANLTRALLHSSLSFLIGSNLLGVDTTNNKIYRTSDKGLRFLKEYNELKRICNRGTTRK